MNNITIKIPDNKEVIDIDDFIMILKENYKEVYLSKNVKIIENEEEYTCNIISDFNNIEEINYDCKYDIEMCYIRLKNGNKYTVMQNDKETLLLVIELIEDCEHLIDINCLKEYQEKNNKDLSDYTLELKKEKNIELNLDKNLNNYKNLLNFKHLLGYVPNKIYDFREKEYKTKLHENHGNAMIRYRFINEDDLTHLDSGFYHNTKIRILQDNIIRYGQYIFLRTIDDNCILIKNNV